VASSVRATARGSALVWLFPGTATPPVDLCWDGEGELTIGRDATCDVHLMGNDVSRRHAVLRKSGLGAVGGDAGVMIADLGSRNGVRVGGQSVSAARLGLGDVVRLGGWVGIVTATPGELKEIAPGLWGGAALQAALATLRQAAVSDLPVVLEGETGTGKELVAGALHLWSGRPGPLVAVNCAALPETLAEGELFGYRRGAFTGADRASPGFFRAAEGGTLLLDEVSDLPLGLQAKLLRVLEQREVQPLGETRPVPIDVRIVVAGQQPLMEVVQAGRFRADLLARLDGLTVRLPPLRERREDVLPLFAHLLQVIGNGRAPAIESDLAERLCLHDWPFNVRELVLLARRLLALHGGDTTLRAQHLPERIGGGVPAPVASNLPARKPAPERTAAAAAAEPIELPALVAALRASGGNVARAAALLGISRQRAYRLMEGQAVDLEGLRKPEEGQE
jgi:DNA-binding NtrC family response regulator